MLESWKLFNGHNILAFAILAMVPAVGVAQDDFAHGRIRYLEQGVTLQRGNGERSRGGGDQPPLPARGPDLDRWRGTRRVPVRRRERRPAR